MQHPGLSSDMRRNPAFATENRPELSLRGGLRLFFFAYSPNSEEMRKLPCPTVQLPPGRCC